MTERQHNTLITDFDNTLYDWFLVWNKSFSAMLFELEKISGIDREVLFPEIRAIHQKYHTSEYAFLIEEMPSLRKAYPNDDLISVFDDAIHAYRSARKSSLQLYPGVKDTLTELRSRGVLIVLYTESLAFYTNFRIRRLGLDDLIDFIYSPPDHALPSAASGSLNSEDSRLQHAKHRFIPAGVIKPNPEVLLDIVHEIGRSPEETVYLGDSLMKDVAMAQDAGIVDILAEYGGVQHLTEYELLQRVSHWSETDVQRERVTSKRDIRPNNAISQFGEILRFFGGPNEQRDQRS